MLFLRYIVEQLGGISYSTSSAGSISGDGVTFLRALNTSTAIGAPNLEAASGQSIDDLIGNWVAALYLDGTNLTLDERFNFESEVVDSFTGQPRGFNLRGTPKHQRRSIPSP